MTDGTRIRVALVDDEPLGRQKLRRMLKSDPDVDIIGEYAGGEEAIAGLTAHMPDLLFLDIEMPGMNGFDVLREINRVDLPHVIFVTAYDQYALKAFEIQALDYLLKPFDKDRFQKALDRARAQIGRQQHSGMDRKLMSVLELFRPQPEYPERIVVKSGGHVLFLRTAELDYVESAGNYVRLHVAGKSHLLRETMNEMQAKLHPQKFVRIHRSTLVNVERVKELQPWFGGGYVVILHNGTKLNMSRTHKNAIASVMSGPSGGSPPLIAER